MNYLENLKALRDAVVAEPAQALHLDAWRISASPDCGTLHCIGGLAATLPFFQAQYMRPHPHSGAPICEMFPYASDTLDHYFGRYAGDGDNDVGATFAVFAALECGYWDHELATAAGALLNGADDDKFIDTDKMGHKQLALARLDKAIAYWEAQA